MPVKVYYNFLGNENIILKEYYGEVSVDDFITSWNEIFNNYKKTTKQLKILSDQRNIHTPLSLQDIEKLVGYFKSIIDSIPKTYVAILTDTPQQTTTGILAMQKAIVIENKVVIQVFTTVGMATSWLKAF